MMSRIFIIVALFMCVTLASTNTPSSSVEDESPSLRSTSHFFDHYNPRASMTCDKFPRVCRATGSPGPDCCRKHCVDVMIDNLNCGECGMKCRYGEACCSGNCVNIMYDAKNCGGCKIRCKKGNFCKYGMCSYA
ncbi:uncharacterized protein A4U43_C06F10900 [Asparagus officinalis]|uniref:Stigma-specific STIG1-like protein 1 n=1 Tax=Asparagus officinalis TaxID=4686 RepID=A0A5P1ELM9_ASPOF|nr:stigma-specific STIG1-like protein 1 [Asparagus officinalis]ONK66684.1 uncharacterized protein A4U43_C06F10900 [Asparagus officinalis]